jgi:hypothetical protein
MCINLCKKHKEKIRELQEAIDRKQAALDTCFSDSNEKDKKIQELQEQLKECKEEEPDPEPDRPSIKSLKIHNGKFCINGRITKLIGVSKREMLAVGSGDLTDLKYNYNYNWIKQAIINSKVNYIRVIIPKNITFARNEVVRFLENGIVLEIELFDAGKPDRAWQTSWQNAFNLFSDLPVFFDAHNEFLDSNQIQKTKEIIDYVTAQGGLIGVGAWGNSDHGQEYSDQLKQATNKYQIVTHHRQWTQASITKNKEPGKPLAWNELHTRDHNLNQIKNFMKMGHKNCEALQVYSLLNFGWGNDSKFQKLLDYVGEIK